jgi:hypothetical protein
LETITLRSIAGLAVLLLALANLLLARDLLDGGRIADSALRRPSRSWRRRSLSSGIGQLRNRGVQQGIRFVLGDRLVDPAARAVGSALLVAEPVLRVAEGFTFPVGNIGGSLGGSLGGSRGSADRTFPRPIARRAGELAAAAPRQGSRKNPRRVTQTDNLGQPSGQRPTGFNLSCSGYTHKSAKSATRGVRV